MTVIYFDVPMSDDERRARLYEGELFVYPARPATQALCALARRMCVEAFAPHDPPVAQYHLPVEKYVEILAELKPAFIHHPEAKQCIQAILQDLGCDAERTFFDVPRLRTVTSDGYLTSGLGYAFKPHRDSWYSTPMCQLNWWLPVFPMEPTNGMAFHPAYWRRKIHNTSEEFNYQQWNQTGRQAAATQIKQDTRRQSEATEELELEPDLRVVCPPGGMIVFSAAHLHSTVPNTSGATRFSIDFRTVHLQELAENTGAPNRDSACTGSTIGDYLRVRDCAHLPAEMIEAYLAGKYPNVPLLE